MFILGCCSQLSLKLVCSSFANLSGMNGRVLNRRLEYTIFAVSQLANRSGDLVFHALRRLVPAVRILSQLALVKHVRADRDSRRSEITYDMGRIAIRNQRGACCSWVASFFWCTCDICRLIDRKLDTLFQAHFGKLILIKDQLLVQVLFFGLKDHVFLTKLSHLWSLKLLLWVSYLDDLIHLGHCPWAAMTARDTNWAILSRLSTLLSGNLQKVLRRKLLKNTSHIAFEISCLSIQIRVLAVGLRLFELGRFKSFLLKCVRSLWRNVVNLVIIVRISRGMMWVAPRNHL